MNLKEYEQWEKRGILPCGGKAERECTGMPYFIYERNQEEGWMAATQNILALWKQVKE